MQSSRTLPLDDAPWIIAAAYFCAGVFIRVFVPSLPNFSPVASLAILAGYSIPSRRLACAVPVVTMLASDVVKGFYDWRVMLVVYAALALPSLAGPFIRRLTSSTKSPAAWLSVPAACLASSLLFFAATNFAVWAFSSHYPRTLAGLLECYAAAVPFFSYTVAGDLLYGVAGFAPWVVAWQRDVEWRASAATVAEINS